MVICDDLLATGGTAKAAGKLVEEIGAKVAGFAFIIELTELNGSKELNKYKNSLAGEILMVSDTAEIGIFGGTGIYDSELLQDSKEITIETPYGKTSDVITIGEFEGKRIAFMPRHGKKHSIPPHLINYCANIWAFKELGITRIISPMAVGSLKEEIKPGDFVLPTQFIDFTKSRRNSFSEYGRVIHISVADPFCPDLQGIVSETAGNQSITLHKDCTYACIEGPRFSTKAEI